MSIQKMMTKSVLPKNPRSNTLTHDPANHGNQAQMASFPKVPPHPGKKMVKALGDVSKPVNASKQPKGTTFGGGVF